MSAQEASASAISSELEKWTEVDNFLSEALIAPDPVLKSALESSRAAGTNIGRAARTVRSDLHRCRQEKHSVLLRMGTQVVAPWFGVKGYDGFALVRVLPPDEQRRS